MFGGKCCGVVDGGSCYGMVFDLVKMWIYECVLVCVNEVIWICLFVVVIKIVVCVYGVDWGGIV